MDRGQRQSKPNKGTHRFISGRSFALLVAPILLSMFIFNHLKKKKKSVEEESTSISPIPTGRDSHVYDVFLSFRGPDTRKGFTNYLYHGLVTAGIVPFHEFRDDYSLSIGEQFGSSLLHEITRSKILIPIISKTYASSKLCLRELICIMDCKKYMSRVVLPIFYRVNLSDVRNLKGSFGRAFHSQKKYFDEKDIREAQRAFREITFLNGWESEKFAGGHEGELVESVIQTVLSKLQDDFQLDVTEGLVGIDNHVDKIRNWVNTSASDARMIGIYGTSGIGKTTLAKVIYTMLSNNFKYRSFLVDIREIANRNGIPYLQNQLIKEIQPDEHQVFEVDDGISLIKAGLKGKKVLILLDDINHKDQLDALARKRNWFMRGSMIIVTTRDEAILDQSEFKVDYKYALNELDKEHSLLLFNRYAFHLHQSLWRLEDISRDIVFTMSGLPLALKIIGSYLYGKTNPEVWQHVLKKLREAPHEDVQKILKISYDALEPRYQEVFLDIACFFTGGEITFPIYMWEDCGFCPSQGIEELKLRCLVEIGDGGKLRVHDQVADFGRNIVLQEVPPERRSGLWLYKEAFGVLMEKKGTKRIEAICFNEDYDPLLGHGATNLQTYTNEQFKNLQSLRLLQLRGGTLSGDFDNLFSELRWLQWFDIESNLCFLATNLDLPKLVVLQLSYNQITNDWGGWSSIMAARQLKVLNLAFCKNLRCTPNLSTFTKLEILILKECCGLKKVDPSIGEVKSLAILDLSFCESLEELPEEVGELRELKELILDYAGITKIPTSIGSLSKLEKLSAWGCQSLGEISSSIGDLPNLQYLDISNT